MKKIVLTLALIISLFSTTSLIAQDKRTETNQATSSSNKKDKQTCNSGSKDKQACCKDKNKVKK